MINGRSKSRESVYYLTKRDIKQNRVKTDLGGDGCIMQPPLSQEEYVNDMLSTTHS